MTDGEVKIRASLDVKDYNRGVDKLIRDLGSAERKLKEFNVEGKRGDSILKGMGLGAVGLGASLVAAMTAGVASSPQFKQFLGELAPAFFELSDALGEKLVPLFDQIVPLVEDFVNFLVNSKVSNAFFDGLVASGQAAIDIINGLKDAYNSLPQSVRDMIEDTSATAVNTLADPLNTGGGLMLGPRMGASAAMGMMRSVGFSEERINIGKRGIELPLEMAYDVGTGDVDELKRDFKEWMKLTVDAWRMNLKLVGMEV